MTGRLVECHRCGQRSFDLSADRCERCGYTDRAGLYGGLISVAVLLLLLAALKVIVEAVA